MNVALQGAEAALVLRAVGGGGGGDGDGGVGGPESGRAVAGGLKRGDVQQEVIVEVEEGGDARVAEGGGRGGCGSGGGGEEGVGVFVGGSEGGGGR